MTATLIYLVFMGILFSIIILIRKPWKNKPQSKEKTTPRALILCILGVILIIVGNIIFVTTQIPRSIGILICTVGGVLLIQSLRKKEAN